MIVRQSRNQKPSANPAHRRRNGWHMIALLAVVPLVGCVIQDPAPHLTNVAVSTSGSATQLLYTACTPEPIKSVALLKSEDPSVYDENNPPIWKITFSEGSSISQFNVGSTPPGSTTQVDLTGPLDQHVLYTAEITSTTGHASYQPFKLKDMGNRVAFNNTYLSQAEFNKRRQC